MRKLAVALIAVPFVALAAQKGAGPAAGAPADDNTRFERMERRMRVARVLGLTEALDLDEAQALKMQDVMAKYDQRRKPLMKQVHDSMQVLRRAATGDQAAQGQVDKAAAQVFDARAQIQQLDREMFGAITKDLSPEKRARAAVFLSHFQGRFGMGPGMMGRGWRGRGMMRGPGPGGGPGGGAGMGGPGMGMGPMGMGPTGGPMGECAACENGEDCPEECAMMMQQQ